MKLTIGTLRHIIRETKLNEIFGFGKSEDADTKELKQKGFRQLGREESREIFGPGIFDDMRAHGQEIWQNKAGKYAKRSAEHGGFTLFDSAEDMIARWDSRIGAPRPNRGDIGSFQHEAKRRKASH